MCISRLNYAITSRQPYWFRQNRETTSLLNYINMLKLCTLATVAIFVCRNKEKVSKLDHVGMLKFIDYVTAAIFVWRNEKLPLNRDTVNVLKLWIYVATQNKKTDILIQDAWLLFLFSGKQSIISGLQFYRCNKTKIVLSIIVYSIAAHLITFCF